ncbi:Zinc transporter ZupT [compost metagenome]
MEHPLIFALTASLVTAVATTAGALPAALSRRIPERMQDALMGFSAGVMLAATSFSLILPALDRAIATGADKIPAAVLVGLSLLLGALFLHLCNLYIPHEHFTTGREGGPSSVTLKRLWLLVLAITLHNLPEGLAVGSGAGSQDLSLALPILTGIALQDVPEGFVVAIAMMAAGYAFRQALGMTVVTGVVEAGAALLGYAAVSQVSALLPFALAFAGGSMLYVVSNEMIPESHHKEHAQEATAGLMLGFVLMMVLDVALS